MKILHAYPHACYGGGSSYYFRSLSKELVKTCNVALLIVEPAQLKLNMQKYDWQIPFRVMGSSSTSWPDAKRYVDLSQEELNIYSEAIYAGMRRAFIDFEPDIIHCHFLLPSGWAAARISKEYQVPVVVSSHGADIKTAESDERYLRENLHFLPYISQVTGVSPNHCDWIKEVFSENELFSPKCMPGGVDVEMYHPEIDSKEIEKIFKIKRKNFVLGVGRFQKRKGFHVLIEAAKHIKSTILLVGDGWEMKNLKLQIEKLGVKNVRLLGFFGPEKNNLLRQLYAAASVVVVPSITREETLCFVGLEALASGTPLIASFVGGLTFITNNGKAGCLIEPNNINQLANSINLLLKDKKMSEEMGKRGRDYVMKNFTWSNIAQEYINLFNELIINKRAD